MARTKTDPSSSQGNNSDYEPPKIGAVLLDLRDALARAERSRRNLKRQGFSQQRWQEIVNDVNPELRFIARLQVPDAIVTYLQSAGKPVSRRALARDLAIQRMWTLERIRHSISTSLRTRKLILFPNNTIGLPEWKKKRP